LHRRDVGPHTFDNTGCLVPEQERELVIDSTFAVVQIRVADTARLDAHESLARTGIGHHDGHE
jgi:hypothetical protein